MRAHTQQFLSNTHVPHQAQRQDLVSQFIAEGADVNAVMSAANSFFGTIEGGSSLSEVACSYNDEPQVTS